MTNPQIENILLLSDSWAWGWYPNHIAETQEWGFFHSNRYLEIINRINCTPQSFPIVEMLLNFYGYNVKNLGDPGSSNVYQAELLEKYLDDSKADIDAIVMIQTDPLRDVFTNFKEEFNTGTDGEWENDIIHLVDFGQWTPNYLESLVEHTILQVYQRMIASLQKHSLDIPVILMGGCGTVQRHIVDKAKTQSGYTNMHVMCENILVEVAYVLTGKPTVMLHPCAMNRISQYCRDDWNRDLVNYLYEIGFATMNKDYPIFFQMAVPDTQHPNAASWIAMIELLVRYIEKNFSQE